MGSYGDFHAMLEDVQARLSDSFDRGNTSWDDKALDDIDAIVQRNIAEVVEAADNAGASQRMLQGVHIKSLWETFR